MARPKSMSDFSQLLDAHTPLGKGYGVERPRKKPSISLAAGLIMNGSDSNTPRSMPQTPQYATSPPTRHDARGYSENLFYAYAQKSNFAPSPPYILTFSSAAVCAQWWDLVRTEYPESTRPGPQLFILKGDDMQEQIQDNPRFYHLRDKWFYTASDGSTTAVLPLQDYYGNPVNGTQEPAFSRHNSIREENEEAKPPAFDLSSLTSTLEKMANMISQNSAQIQALSVAQSSGLQSMQAINESNSTQIKNLTDNQAKLQALIDQNASHYIALSNSSFQNHTSVKETLTTTAEQLSTLSSNQTQMTKTCQSMIKSIESVNKNINGLGSNINALAERDRDREEREQQREQRERDLQIQLQRERQLNQQRRASDAGSTASSVGTAPYSGAGRRISPAPRKLNRKIRGVWYEYDSALLDTPSKSSANTSLRT